MRISEEEALEAMIKSGVHGQQRPRHVYAIAVYNGNEYFTARNTNRQDHAEVEAIAHLQGLLMSRQLQPRVIKLFVSASPCSECSQRIITFLETARWHHGVHLKIEVVFSSFYRIQRPSCNRRNPVCRDHNHCPLDNDHWTQVEGLKTLKVEPDVVLRTFNKQDWHNLRSLLRVYNIGYRCRKKEDELLKKDFKEIMGSTTTRKLGFKYVSNFSMHIISNNSDILKMI